MVYLVGAGPGDPGLLTVRGKALLAEADAVVYDWLVNPALLELAPRAEKIYVGKNVGSKRRTLHKDSQRYVKQNQTNHLLVKLAREGKTVVRLKGGDPFIFGRGGEEASYLKKRGVGYEVVPGITAGYAAPAYAGIPVTDRRFSSLVTFVTGHEDPAKKESSIRWKELAKIGGTLVSFMGVRNLLQVVQALLDGGMDSRTKVSVIEWGTLPWQRVVEGTLKDIVRKVRNRGIQSPAVTVIGKVNDLREELAWFSGKARNGFYLTSGEKKDRKPLSGKTVLVTRARAQASALRKILEEKGARVLEFPTIRILQPRSWSPVDRALREMAKFDWVIFTSANGVDSFFKRLNHIGLDARIFHSAKIAVIGDATKTALQEKGVSADLVPDQFTSRSLLEKLQKTIQIRGRHFLLARTDIAPDFLHKQLEALGAKVTDVVVYRTVPVRDGKKKLNNWLEREAIDYVLFTSSSTVKNFFTALPKRKKLPEKTRFVSIGPVTSEALRSYGYGPYLEAREHTIPGLVESLTNGFQI